MQPEEKQFVANKTKPKHYFSTLKLILQVGGMYPIYEDADTWSKTFINAIFFTMPLLGLLYATMLGFLDLVMSWDGDLEVSANIMLHLVIFWCSLMVTFYYQVCWKKLRDLLEFATKNFRYRSARGISVLTMAPALRASTILTRLICLMNTILLLHESALIPILNSTPGHWVTPLRCKCESLNPQTSPYYELAYAMQVYSEFAMCVCYAQISALFACLCILTCNQMAIAGCVARNACETPLVRAGVPHGVLLAAAPPHNDVYFFSVPEIVDCDYDQNGPIEFRAKKANQVLALPTAEQRRQYEREVLALLGECVEIQVVAREFCSRMEGFFGRGFFIQLPFLMVLFCNTMYANKSSFHIAATEYLTDGFLHLLALCYFSNQINLESEKVARAAYNAPWYEYGPSVRRGYVMIISQATRPLSITAAHIIKMDLLTCIGLLKLAFSFFTLMTNLE